MVRAVDAVLRFFQLTSVSPVAEGGDDDDDNNSDDRASYCSSNGTAQACRHNVSLQTLRSRVSILTTANRFSVHIILTLAVVPTVILAHICTVPSIASVTFVTNTAVHVWLIFTHSFFVTEMAAHLALIHKAFHALGLGASPLRLSGETGAAENAGV